MTTWLENNVRRIGTLHQRFISKQACGQFAELASDIVKSFTAWNIKQDDRVAEQNLIMSIKRFRGSESGARAMLGRTREDAKKIQSS